MGKMSNYPKGFRYGVNVRGLPVLNTYGGNVYWVDSNTGSDSGSKGGTFDHPFDTIDYAVGRCTADNGDIILVKPGHVETVIAAGGLDLDVAGITIIFMGEGANKAYITFTTAVSADMDVDAASITLINPKFVAGIDALTGPIDVNATDFTIINGEWHDASSIETTDCIVATAGATRLCIDGWKFFKSDEGGTQKESHVQLNGVDDAVLRNIQVEGDFDTAIIENVTDEILRATLDSLYLKNTDPGNGPCISLDSAASGWASNVNCRNANGVGVDDAADINWTDDCLQYSTDGEGGSPIGTAMSDSLEDKVDTVDGIVDAILVDTGTTLPATLAAVPQCVVKTDGAVLNGNDDIFTVAGGPVRAKIVGLVTTVIGGAANGRLKHTTTTPAATIDLNAGAVAIDSDAAGTIYTNQGATSVFTPSGGLGFDLLDPVTVEETEMILAPGTVHFNGSAAQSGVIAWYMSFVPLSPSSTVTAAA